MSLQYFVVNAFTSHAFEGNPATVVMVPQNFLGMNADSDAYVNFFQKLAGEVSNVETAFVLPPDQNKTDYRLRFFTKSRETTFCGHATIAAAHILSTEFNFPSDQIYFSTKSGVVVVKCSDKKRFELDLHPTMPTAVPGHSVSNYAAQWPMLAKALFGKAAPPPTAMVYHEPSQNLILQMNSVASIVSAQPDSLKLLDAVEAIFKDVQVLKLTVTAAPVSEDDEKWRQFDFVTRLFAPWIGIAEDAVSGATHAILAQYWRSVRPEVRDKRSLRCFQPSSRGGEITLNVHGERVGVAGEAVSVCSGIVHPISKM